MNFLRNWKFFNKNLIGDPCFLNFQLLALNIFRSVQSEIKILLEFEKIMRYVLLLFVYIYLLIIKILF